MSVATEPQACPVEGCDAAINRPENLRRHVERVHGVKKDSAEWRRLFGLAPKNVARVSYTRDIEQQISDTAKPLRESLRLIERRLATIDEEKLQLQTDRRRLLGVLRLIDPTSFVAKPKKDGASQNGSPEMNDAKRQAVVEFIQKQGYEDGLTAAAVYRDMKAAGAEPISSAGKVLDIVRELHAQGVLRADRKMRGGAMQYKLVTNGGNDGT